MSDVMPKRMREGDPTGVGDAASVQSLASSAEVRKRRVSTRRLPTVDSPVSGVKFITEPGMHPDIPRITTERLLKAARTYFALYLILEEVRAQMKPSEDKLRTTVKRRKGFRGLEVDGEFRLPISYPSTTIWSRDKLHKAAGKHYPQVAPKEHVTITADLDTTLGISPAVLLGAMGLVLREFYHCPEEEVRAMLNMIVEPDVDEKAVDELIEKGIMRLPRGARRINRGTPTINKPTILEKRP
jgi:hypothetical protein